MEWFIIQSRLRGSWLLKWWHCTCAPAYPPPACMCEWFLKITEGTRVGERKSRRSVLVLHALLPLWLSSDEAPSANRWLSNGLNRHNVVDVVIGFLEQSPDIHHASSLVCYSVAHSWKSIYMLSAGKKIQTMLFGVWKWCCIICYFVLKTCLSFCVCVYIHIHTHAHRMT